MTYLRISQDRTGEELGVERQRQDAKRMARARGWRIVAEFADNDTSASGKARRPGFDAMLAAVEAGKAAGVIAWDLTRLTRNSRDRLRLLEVGKAAGATIALVRGSDMDLGTPAGRLTADILGSVAQHEIEQKSDRQKRAAVQAAEAGKRVGGRRPFGYEADGITIRPDEAEAVRWGYREILAGLSLGAVAREWNARGLSTPQAAFSHGCGGTCGRTDHPRSCPARRADQPSWWDSQTAGPVLLNPRYAGFRVHLTDEIRKRHPDPRKARIAAIVPGVVAQWAALVDESTWRAAVAMLMDPARARPAKFGQRMLTGEALCGVCGATVHAGGANAGGAYAMYRCSRSQGHIARAAEPVDWFVGEVVIARLSRPDAADLLVAEDGPDLDEVRQGLLALRERRTGVLALVADGTFSAAEARSRVAALDTEIQAAEASLADSGRVDVLGPLVDAEDVRAAWEAMDNDRRRAVVGALMTVRLMSPGRGTRLGRTVAAWEAQAERIAASLDVAWS